MHKEATRSGAQRLWKQGLCLLLAYALLAGCSARQGGGTEESLSLRVPAEEAATPLSPAEQAALQSSGPIDRNIPADAMQEVTLQYKHFLNKGRPTMKIVSKRAENYLAYSRKVFRTRGMPEELAYLAIVESGYRPDAVSRAGAAGAWQFMPYTGMKYGLNQDWWMDERLDPYRATEAAADYLQKLYGDFRDWPTAIAAYNAGEGKMRRAMEGTGTRNFYGVCQRNEMLDEKAQLRDETKQYVPRFIAITKIMRNLPQLGFEPIRPESAPLVLRFTARPGTDLMGLSRACGISWEDFVALNRHHRRPITSTERSTFVYVPQRVEHQATAFLRGSGSTAFAQWQPKKVQTSSDSWAKISKRSGVSIAQLKSVNPGTDAIYAGDTILVPRNVNMSASAVNRQGGGSGKSNVTRDRRPAPAAVASSGKMHTLQPNETLYGVARKYGVSVAAIQEANDISNPNSLRAGQNLRIPGTVAVAERKNPSGRLGASRSGRSSKRTTYTVRPGDNLWNIARRYDVSVDDLKRWNNVDENALRVGATMIVEAN